MDECVFSADEISTMSMYKKKMEIKRKSQKLFIGHAAVGYSVVPLQLFIQSASYWLFSHVIPVSDFVPCQFGLTFDHW